MANKPDYNLNEPGPENLDENAIQKILEKQSSKDPPLNQVLSFKVVVATSALETGVVKR